MVLSNVDLHRSSNTFKSSSNTLKTRDLDRSLFIESLDMIAESDKFFNNTLKDLHIKVTLSESSDLVFLNEFSVVQLISNVIDMFVDTIKKIFGVFKNAFNRLFDTDKKFRNNESKIKNMKGEFNLSFPRYNYTIYDDIPTLDVGYAFEDSYVYLTKKVKEIKALHTVNERRVKMETIESDLRSSYDGSHYAVIRAKTLKSRLNGITEDEYAAELFNTFRDGGGQITSKITPIDATVIYDRYMKHNDVLKSVEKLKQSTIKSAEDVKKKISGLTLGYTTTKEEDTLFSKILSVVIGDINTICNIFVMAFSAKCDAVKESARQDRRTLNEILDYINTGMNS